MKLLNSDIVIIEIKKIRTYYLNSLHPRSRNKAGVFASVLGLTTGDAENLREALLSAAVSEEAVPAGRDEYGQSVRPMSSRPFMRRWRVKSSISKLSDTSGPSTVRVSRSTVIGSCTSSPFAQLVEWKETTMMYMM